MIPVTTLIMQCDVCRKAGPDIAGKTEFVTVKSLNVKVLFFLIKVWNMKNVSISFQQKPIPQLSMFCLIEGITNYVQINTYWSYIVQICIFINLASNILFCWQVKRCFLTSQGLVGAGMNCRALSIYSNDSFHFWHFHNRVTCLSFDPIL